MQRHLDPETGVNKPFQNVSCQGRIQNFFQGESTKFCHFFKRNFFSAELILSNLSNKNDSMGVQGHVSPENFCKFAYCNGHFRAFRTIFRQSLFIFLAPNFECFIKYDAFCKYSFDYACLRRLRFIVMSRGANLC